VCDLDTLSQRWIDAKRIERDAIENRRAAENSLLSLIGIPQALEGTETIDTDTGYSLKIVGRLTRRVDASKLQQIALEFGLSEHLNSLFRFKPEINLSVWKNSDPKITTPLLEAITTTPGRASFTITKEEEYHGT
jgi:hypothetical protein